MTKRVWDDGDVNLDDNTPIGRLKSFRCDIRHKLTIKQLQHFDRIIENIASYRLEEIGPTLASISMVPIELWGYILGPLTLADKMRFYLAAYREFPRFGEIGPGLSRELIIDKTTYQYQWVDLLKTLQCLLQFESIIFGDGLTKVIHLIFTKHVFPNLKTLRISEDVLCPRFLDKHSQTLEVLHLRFCQPIPQNMPKLIDLKPYPRPRDFTSDLSKRKTQKVDKKKSPHVRYFDNLALELAKHLTTWQIKTPECWSYADCLDPEYSPRCIIATMDGSSDWIINKRTYPKVTELKILARYNDHDTCLMDGLRDVAYAFPNVAKISVKPVYDFHRDYSGMNDDTGSMKTIDYRFLSAYFPSLAHFTLKHEKSLLRYMFRFPSVPEINMRVSGYNLKWDEMAAEYAFHITEPNPIIISHHTIPHLAYKSRVPNLHHFIRITPSSSS